jgi:hypothetical protein
MVLRVGMVDGAEVALVALATLIRTHSYRNLTYLTMVRMGHVPLQRFHIGVVPHH